jgi:GxxExxY protein
MVVENVIILELKSVVSLHPKHAAQTLNYLKATGLRLGILINFGEQKLVYERIVN